MSDLPEAARAERQAIFDQLGTASTDSHEGDLLVLRSTPEQHRAIVEWADKWDAEQYSILLPFKAEDHGDHWLTYYRLEMPEFVDA